MDNEYKRDYSPEQEVKIGRRVTWVGFWTNAVLAALKIAAGIAGRSGAMVADGVHSLSDFVTDIIVIVMIGISRKKADAKYSYGHGKYETFATMLISMALAGVAVGIFCDGCSKMMSAMSGEYLPRPGMIALVMAIVSILSKEALFHYTIFWGRKIHSSSVMANAWHHRSDMLSSIATLAGISGAMFLGEHWRILDPMAAVIVSVFIFIVAVRLGMPSVKELLEISLPSEITEPMFEIVRTTPGVITFHNFRSRRNGNKLILDLHIKVDPNKKVVEAHDIASDVERRLKERFGKDMICNIHIEPYKGEAIGNGGMCND